MAAINVTPEMYHKFGGKYGELKMSTGFFQRFYEKNGQITEPGILQVTNYRLEGKENGNGCARFRLSDGCFYSACVYMAEALRDQVERDTFMPSGHGGEIIAVTKMHQSGTTKEGRVALTITEYTLLARSPEKTHMGGSCQRHDGTPASVDEFRNFKPTAEHFIPWGESSWDDASVGAKPGSAAPSMSSSSTTSTTGSRPPAPTRQPSSFGAGGGSSVTPIKMITPYVNKWRICGMCTGKEDLKDIKTKNGEMKVFNFEITDKDGDAIRIAGFGDAAQRASSLIQLDCSYFISGGSVKQANKRFNATGHDYELSIRSDTEITPCQDSIPPPQFHLHVVPLDKITEHKDQMVDVLAVIDKVEPVNEFTSKAGKPCVKRELQLIDESRTIVQFVLWGEAARTFDENALGQVIGIKGAAVKEWNGGFSLGTGSGSRYELSPNLTEVPQLYEWYANDRPNAETKTMTTSATGGGAFGRDLRLIGTAQCLNLGNEPDGPPSGRYMNVKGMVTNVKTEQVVYPACANEGCSKKVVCLDAQYRCEKCNTTNDSFKWNYMMQVEVSDCTGSFWMTIFSKPAEKLLGKSAQEIGDLKESNPDEYKSVIESVRFKNFIWRVRAKGEVYNEECRIRYNCMDVNDVPYDKYIEELEKTLAKLEQI